MGSEHLDKIIPKDNQIAYLRVVFMNIEAYSKRRTLRQVTVIAAFTECLDAALRLVSQKYDPHTRTNEVNYVSDVICLPGGDGAAVGFPFRGTHDIHIAFAKEILSQAATRRDVDCDRFNSAGWCNCHDHFNLRIGVSEGKCVVYRDVNRTHNIAGGPVTMAARIMNRLDGNQVGLSEAAYTQYVDSADGPNIADSFREYLDVRLKDHHRISIYQYIEDSALGLNNRICEALSIGVAGDGSVERRDASESEPWAYLEIYRRRKHLK